MVKKVFCLGGESVSRRSIVLPNREKELAEYSIVGLDIQNNTVHIRVNGCKVAVICKPKPNPDVYNDVKEILINTVFG